MASIYKRINNKDMHKFTTFRTPFKNNNETCWGGWNWDTSLYAVFSYGHHFPMYVYDAQAQQWYGNEDKYSRTTTRHQSQARPRTEAGIEWMSTEALAHLISSGGVAGAVARRIEYAINTAA